MISPKVGFMLFFYVSVALAMCAFILLNDQSESIGNPSPVSTVRSTQKGSVIEYITSSLAVLFFITCILLNRMMGSNNSIVKDLIASEQNPENSHSDNPHSDNPHSDNLETNNYSAEDNSIDSNSIEDRGSKAIIAHDQDRPVTLIDDDRFYRLFEGDI